MNFILSQYLLRKEALLVLSRRSTFFSRYTEALLVLPPLSQFLSSVFGHSLQAVSNPKVLAANQ